MFAAKAVAAHPEKSDRTIAKEIGVSDKTVAKARKATAEKSAVAKRIGRDGKARKLPNKRMTPEAAERNARPRRSGRTTIPAASSRRYPKRPALSLSRRCGCWQRAGTLRRYLVERQRARLNLDWSDLLVPSDENESPLRVASRSTAGPRRFRRMTIRPFWKAARSIRSRSSRRVSFGR